MLHKPLISLFIVVLISITPAVASSSINSSNNQQTSELLSYSLGLTVTSGNITSLASTIIHPGLILAGGQNYQVLFALSNKIPIILNVVFSRLTEVIYFNIDSANESFIGIVSFNGCCANILDNLSINFVITSHVSTINQNGTLFRLDLAIYKIPLTSYQGFIPSSEVNVLGYPYPPKLFILGLMINLLGILPLAILFKVIMKFTRRQPK